MSFTVNKQKSPIYNNNSIYRNIFIKLQNLFNKQHEREKICIYMSFKRKTRHEYRIQYSLVSI